MLTDNPTVPLILIVEDDCNHLDLIQRSFEDAREEYRLEVACTLIDACKVIELHPPDLVLTDFRLPDGDGNELVVKMNETCPVIVMTAQGSEQAAVQAMKIGAQDYIVKSPEAFEKLPHSVKYALTTWELIEARKQLADANLRAKQDWEKTFDAVPDLISIIDLGHTIIRVNKAMAERCGLTAEEIIGRTCCEIVHGLKNPPNNCPVSDMMQNGRAHNVVLEEKGLAGFFDVTVSPLYDEEGLITAYVHFMRDITPRKLAEEALRESEEKHRKLAIEQQLILNTSSGKGIWFIKDRKVLWANPAYDAIFGYETGTTHDMDVAEFYAYKETYEYVGEEACSTIESGVTYSQDVMMKKKDGSLFWCNLAAQAINPDDEKEGSIWIMQDISERKQMSRSLEEKQVRLSTLVQTIPDMIWLKGVDGVYLACNSLLERYFGATEADIIGKTDYDFVDREQADSIRDFDRKIMADGVPKRERMDHLSGQWSAGLARFDQSSDVRQRRSTDGVLGIARDITERRQAEENNLEMERKFQQTQKLESLGVLAGGIAHDFNNILTVILGHCYLVKEDDNSESKSTMHIQQIEKAAYRATDLCRQMLTYAGKSPLVQTEINLWLQIDEIVKMLKSAIKKNVSFKLDMKRDVPVITGDSAQIQQVIMNLIINAAEAINDNNGTVTVELAKIDVPAGQADKDYLGNAIPAGKYASLVISDTGCGMDEETQKRIFEPFFTTKFTGRGLGMSAILGIIKSHNGNLQLFSKPGAGTTFKVNFPLAEEPDSVKIAQTAGPALSVMLRGTVLLVDDEADLRSIGTILLESMGLSVITASNGREALEIYRERGRSIDLVLLDMIMPVMGGLEVYNELRKVAPALPIIICSGYIIEEFAGNDNSDKYSREIQKPYRPDQLRNVLLELLETK